MKLNLKTTAKILVLVILFQLHSSCKKITEFTVSDSTSFTVPAGSTVGVPVTSNNQIATSSSVEFKANGGDIKNVKEVRLDRLLLAITNPPSETFSFLNSINLYIQANGLPEARIAYLDNISSGVGNTLELVTTGAVLDGYIKQENYTLRIETVTDEILTQDVDIQADMTFRVRAKIL